MWIGRPEFTTCFTHFYVLGTSTTIKRRPSTSAALSRAQEKENWVLTSHGRLVAVELPFQPCAYFPAKTTIFNLAHSLNLLAQSRDAGPTASQIFYRSGPQLCNGVTKRKSSRRYAFVKPRDTEKLNSGSAFQSSHISERLNSTDNCFEGIPATLLSTPHRWLHWSDLHSLLQRSWPAT
jgi:hypothetical protein